MVTRDRAENRDGPKVSGARVPVPAGGLTPRLRADTQGERTEKDL